MPANIGVIAEAYCSAVTSLIAESSRSLSDDCSPE